MPGQITPRIVTGKVQQAGALDQTGPWVEVDLASMPGSAPKLPFSG
jgi:hypothetical protein